MKRINITTRIKNVTIILIVIILRTIVPMITIITGVIKSNLRYREEE